MYVYKIGFKRTPAIVGFVIIVSALLMLAGPYTGKNQVAASVQALEPPSTTLQSALPFPCAVESGSQPGQEPPTAVFIIVGGIHRRYFCILAAADGQRTFQDADGVISLSGSVGDASAVVNYKGELTKTGNNCQSPPGRACRDQQDIFASARAYVRGAPNTRYRFEFTRTATVEASISLPEGFGVVRAAVDGIRDIYAQPAQPPSIREEGIVYPQISEGRTRDECFTHSGATYCLAAGPGIGALVEDEITNHGNSLMSRAFFDAVLTMSVNIVRAGQQPPVARIDGPSQVAISKLARFDGTNSYDPDGRIVEYKWEFQTTSKSEVRFGPTID